MFQRLDAARFKNGNLISETRERPLMASTPLIDLNVTYDFTTVETSVLRILNTPHVSEDTLIKNVPVAFS